MKVQGEPARLSSLVEALDIKHLTHASTLLLLCIDELYLRWSRNMELPCRIPLSMLLLKGQTHNVQKRLAMALADRGIRDMFAPLLQILSNARTSHMALDHAKKAYKSSFDPSVVNFDRSTWMQLYTIVKTDPELINGLLPLARTSSPEFKKGATSHWKPTNSPLCPTPKPSSFFECQPSRRKAWMNRKHMLSPIVRILPSPLQRGPSAQAPPHTLSVMAKDLIILPPAHGTPISAPGQVPAQPFPSHAFASACSQRNPVIQSESTSAAQPPCDHSPLTSINFHLLPKAFTKADSEPLPRVLPCLASTPVITSLQALSRASITPLVTVCSAPAVVQMSSVSFQGPGFPGSLSVKSPQRSSDSDEEHLAVLCASNIVDPASEVTRSPSSSDNQDCEVQVIDSNMKLMHWDEAAMLPALDMPEQAASGHYLLEQAASAHQLPEIAVPAPARFSTPTARFAKPICNTPILNLTHPYQPTATMPGELINWCNPNTCIMPNQTLSASGTQAGVTAEVLAHAITVPCDLVVVSCRL